MTKKGLIEKVERLEEELDNLDSRVKLLKRDVVISFFTGEYEGKYEYGVVLGRHQKLEDVGVKELIVLILAHLGLDVEVSPATKPRATLKPNQEKEKCK